ncbi:MAG TPA: cytochrome c biogenesis heme-transporting ATPase CcmA [Ramlibacter sp.]|nr:cytochrome c biogenesis heme-transporting ATPase CcmA [Ramlibacter sp.]
MPTIKFMLSGSNLACVRGERPLFSGIDFTVAPGEWLHVRGANGVGKTSLLRILAGLSQPDHGEVRWGDTPVSPGLPAFRRELLYLGHQPAVKEDLSARENLELACALDGCGMAAGAAASALRRFGLGGREDLPVRFLSAGQKRRVLLARLAARRARLWILDEPFTALDTRAVEMLGALAGEHLAAGGMVVLTSHQATPLAEGKVLQLGGAAAARAQTAVRDVIDDGATAAWGRT